MKRIDELLQLAIGQQATDLHLVANKPPIFRIHGELIPSGLPVCDAQELAHAVGAILTPRHKAIFDEKKELDFSYHCSTEHQFRVNVHSEKGNVAVTIRITSGQIKSAEELGLPPVIKDFAKRRKGLFIVSGTAGSGKSTTMTYLIDLINNERKAKVITIEDPIEFIHESKQSLIVQREVGTDTDSFAQALKYALRQDPDVVVVGEMRDLESISMALTTAETGHLVFTTLHASDTIESLNRIIDVCPTGKQEQIRLQLAENLIGVVGQILIPRKNETGRVLATEVLIVNMAIRNLIRRGSFVEIRGQLDNDVKSGTHTLETCLSRLANEGTISQDTAREYAKYPQFLRFETPEKKEPVEPKEPRK